MSYVEPCAIYRLHKPPWRELYARLERIHMSLLVLSVALVWAQYFIRLCLVMDAMSLVSEFFGLKSVIIPTLSYFDFSWPLMMGKWWSYFIEVLLSLFASRELEEYSPSLGLFRCAVSLTFILHLRFIRLHLNSAIIIDESLLGAFMVRADWFVSWERF